MRSTPLQNDFVSSPVPRLEKIYGWMDHILELGVNAVYLGPVFESMSHGYDTVDYLNVDRRLGNKVTLQYLIREFHERGIKIVLDGVFNHAGRDFWAFRNLLSYQYGSPYKDWFSGVRFDKKSVYRDPFYYDGWNGHYSLVKFNLKNPDVIKYIYDIAGKWILEFQIDGLRLDAAECMDTDFLAGLSEFCKKLRPNFWLMGEMIHGDYRKLLNHARLDSVTNYECYKGLWSSLNDGNYFEIAYSLNRQFGSEGIYKDYSLYSFADNHDVSRVSSILTNTAHLFPLYCLLFTIPGIPSIYYGSECGITGKKEAGHDINLRPSLDLTDMKNNSPHPELLKTIKNLTFIRLNSKALKYGDYRQIYVSHLQFAFIRSASGESILTAINSDQKDAFIEVNVKQKGFTKLIDLLNKGEIFEIDEGKTKIHLYPNWAGIFKMA